jgi:hypothetical protein
MSLSFTVMFIQLPQVAAVVIGLIDISREEILLENLIREQQMPMPRSKFPHGSCIPGPSIKETWPAQRTL